MTDGSALLVRARATVHTANSHGYLDEMCRHFGHRVHTQLGNGRGSVQFDEGTLLAHARPQALELELSAQDPKSLERLQALVTAHIERWGEADQLRVDWRARER